METIVNKSLGKINGPYTVVYSRHSTNSLNAKPCFTYCCDFCMQQTHYLLTTTHYGYLRGYRTMITCLLLIT